VTVDLVGGRVPPAARSARREELLDAADRAVQRDGPGTSMAAVAAQAGISKPILYRHFGDKAGLVAALADRHTARLMLALRAALATGRTRRERLRLTVEAYLAAIEAAPQLYRFLLRPEGAAAPEQVRTFTRRLGDVLADGIAAELGVAPAGSRERAWGHGIVGMVQTAGDWWLETAACPRGAMAEQLTDLVLGAYAAAGAPAPGAAAGPGPAAAPARTRSGSPSGRARPS